MAKKDEHEETKPEPADEKAEPGESDESDGEQGDEEEAGEPDEEKGAQEEPGESAEPEGEDGDEESDEEDEEEEGDEDDEDEGDEDDAEGLVAEDAYWWTPHAVLGVLLLIGLLGFFGFFNNLLGFLAPSSGGSGEGRGKDPGAPHAKIIPQQLRRLPNMADRGAEATRYRARHVLVTYKGAPRAPGSVTRTKEEARARAEEAVKKAHAGAKFEDVVKEYSDDADTTPRGGDLGPFSKGRMVPSFQGAVEKLKVGEVSEVVETPFGYHVILRTL